MSYQRGNQLYEAGRYQEAVREYQAALRESDDPDLYENLGLALWQLQDWRPAARCLLRALDGDYGKKEQLLRVLVSCFFRDGRSLDGERLLGEYEARFGAHPEGWKRL